MEKKKNQAENIISLDKIFFLHISINLLNSFLQRLPEVHHTPFFFLVALAFQMEE